MKISKGARTLCFGAYAALLASCGEAQGPAGLAKDPPADPQAMVVGVEGGRSTGGSGVPLNVRVTSAKARPSALLLTVRWDPRSARLSDGFLSPDGHAIVAADTETPGRLRIAVVGMHADMASTLDVLLGRFRLEPTSGGARRVVVSIDVEQAIEENEPVPAARIVVAPLEIDFTRQRRD